MIKYKSQIMRCIKYNVILFLTLSLFSCSKTNKVSGTSALTLVNALPTSNGLVTSFLAANTNNDKSQPVQYSSSSLQVYYNSWVELSSYSGLTHLSLLQTSDTVNPIITLNLDLQLEQIYSLFITGLDTLHIDTLLTKDIIPTYLFSDSLTGIRFINLSAGSQPIKITLQSDTTHSSIVGNIAYKASTTFEQFSCNADALANGYIFEIRDAISNIILVEVPFNVGTYPALLSNKCVTIAFIGQPGVNPSIQLSGLIIPNY